MQFEILNTLQFFGCVLFAGMGFYYLKKRVTSLNWKYFFISLIGLILISHKTFYTLTEKVDVERTQIIMLDQSNSITNSKSIDKYLNNNQPIDNQPTEQDIEQELIKQQQKSKALAIEIETKGK